MATFALPPPLTMEPQSVSSSPCMERLEAARALLGVSPATTSMAPPSPAPSSCSPNSSTRASAPACGSDDVGESATAAAQSPEPAPAWTPSRRPRSSSFDASLVSLAGRESRRSGIGALDALAALATSASVVVPAPSPSPYADRTCSASVPDCGGDDDSDCMPPPPPRSASPCGARAASPSPYGGGGGRARSVSNPEGMEKWDSLRHAGANHSRRHFVLPSSILEEELADASAACAHRASVAEADAHAEDLMADEVMSDAGAKSADPYLPDVTSSSSACRGHGLPLKKRMQQMRSHRSQSPGVDIFGTSPDSVMAPIEEEPSTLQDEEEDDEGKVSDEGQQTEDETEEDESDLEPAELLRRARARLLEDLSTEGAMGEKGVLPLPHSLSKYKEVYNKNGRIGIYTPAERAAIIAKFNSKRSRRVWNKKIRYNCRKNLADRRMRVKGRFVKRSTEQAAQLKAQLDRQAEEAEAAAKARGKSGASPDEITSDGGDTTSSSNASSRTSSPDPACAPAAPRVKTVRIMADPQLRDHDEDMPDVNDPEAGFEPTKDQPYRRTRRHTIT